MAVGIDVTDFLDFCNHQDVRSRDNWRRRQEDDAEDGENLLSMKPLAAGSKLSSLLHP